MGFTLTNNSQAVITRISGIPDGEATFTITSGSLPLYSGDSLTATNTTIINNFYTFFGSEEGQISLFIEQGACQIELYSGTTLLNSVDASSGWVTINTPVLYSNSSVSITLKNEALPFPSQTPTPSVTAQPTPTPSATPPLTPTPTPSATPGNVTPQSLGAVYYVDFTDSSNLVFSASTDYVLQAKNNINSQFNFNYYDGAEPNVLYSPNGYDTGKGSIVMTGDGLTSTGLTTAFSASTSFLLVKINADANTDLISVFDGSTVRNQKTYQAGTDAIRNNQASTGSTSAVQVNYAPYTYGGWDVLAFRSYQDPTLGNTAEVWLNGNLVASGSNASRVIRTINNAAMSYYIAYVLGGSTGNNFMAAAIEFNKKLTDTEMSQMFDFMSWKY